MKVVYFNNDNQTNDYCTDKNYKQFIDYAFAKTNYFMLVYVNYYGKGYSKTMKYYRKKLKRYEVKSRTNPSWPGTPETYCPNTTYKIIFYKNNEESKEILKSVEAISQWSGPTYPQDLAFFIGNQCWFFSVGHEKMATVIRASDEDIEFVTQLGLATKEDVLEMHEDFMEYDEEIEL